MTRIDCSGIPAMYSQGFPNTMILWNMQKILKDMPRMHKKLPQSKGFGYLYYQPVKNAIATKYAITIANNYFQN